MAPLLSAVILVHALHCAHGLDLHVGNHAAVSNHDQRDDAEVLAHRLHLRQKRFRIGRVALEDGNRNRAAAGVREQAVELTVSSCPACRRGCYPIFSAAGRSRSSKLDEVRSNSTRPPSFKWRLASRLSILSWRSISQSIAA